jgi:flagellar biosynthetic protein FlhB
VLHSREITSALLLMLGFAVLKVYGGTAYARIESFTKKIITEYPGVEGLYTLDTLSKLFIEVLTVIALAAAPILAVTFIASLVSGYAQVGFIFTTEAIAFKLERLNPFNGIKRIFSIRSVAELVKSIFKIGVIGYMAYSFLKNEAYNLLATMDMSAHGIGTYIGMTAINLALRICAVLIIMAVFDYGYQWWEYEKNLRMSKQEVKEEYKQVEGNPEIKSKIKQKQRQISMNRMLQDVPKADVVITNPTHYAVALKYDAEVSPAPVVSAKGQGYIALRIKEIAGENSVQVVENKPLARTLYETVEVGDSVPPELYQAVAEVLAYVYSLKGK